MLSETLRLELEPLGVRVLTAMIGVLDTQLYSKVKDLSLPQGSHYKKIAPIINRQRKGLAFKNRQDPNVTARNIVHDLGSGRSSFVWRGASATLSWCFTWMLPTSVMTSMLNNDNGLADLASAES